MQKRRLGNSDIYVSPIGLGTVKFGRTLDLKYPHSFELPDHHELANLISIAKDQGINLIDTAPAYGVSEERLGLLLKGSRQEWVVSTKAGEQFQNGKSSFDFSRSAIIKSVESSLDKLNTDYLDIVLIHSNGDDEQIIKTQSVFETLMQLKQAGKIRLYGMSTKTITGGLLAAEMSDIVMITYNTQHLVEEKVIHYAHQTQKGVFIKKALISGHLSLTPKEHIDFVLKQRGVTSAIVGTINPDHLCELC